MVTRASVFEGDTIVTASQSTGTNVGGGAGGIATMACGFAGVSDSAAVGGNAGAGVAEAGARVGDDENTGATTTVAGVDGVDRSAIDAAERTGTFTDRDPRKNVLPFGGGGGGGAASLSSSLDDEDSFSSALWVAI